MRTQVTFLSGVILQRGNFWVCLDFHGKLSIINVHIHRAVTSALKTRYCAWRRSVSVAIRRHEFVSLCHSSSQNVVTATARLASVKSTYYDRRFGRVHVAWYTRKYTRNPSRYFQRVINKAILTLAFVIRLDAWDEISIFVEGKKICELKVLHVEDFLRRNFPRRTSHTHDLLKTFVDKFLSFAIRICSISLQSLIDMQDVFLIRAHYLHSIIFHMK